MPNVDEIHYAIAHTRVILAPKQALQTFGNTVIHYHLLTEKMDSINEIRIREGLIHTEKPQVLTPAYFQQLMLEGFGDDGSTYVDWLKDHFHDLTFMKYGFRFRKEEIREETIHDNLLSAGERVTESVKQKNNPFSTVLTGVDDSWEICLLKFVTDVIRNSASSNFDELRKHNLLESIQGIPRAVRDEIEGDLQAAGSDSSKIKLLGNKLRYYGIFEQYEDRFYEIVRRIKE
ncbi:MAG: hypothetical protein SGI71_06590 [Verrucomicrobiota bacterium]|nr:hypothetical protein [Verrucomicrobiota bacterium]